LKHQKLAAWAGISIGLAVCAHVAHAGFDSYVSIDHPAIQYYKAPVDDPVYRLGKKLESGEVKLQFAGNGLAWLPSLLKALDINPDSQMLVFSKTSFQASRIGPRTPRALFFNDTVAVGSVQNGEVFELVSQDPRLGTNFYTLDVSNSAKPVFDRRDVCLQCHMGPATTGVPGILISTVFPSTDGTPAFKEGQVVTDARTPISERWGGWYVTGLMGSQQHRGNAIAPDPSRAGLLDTRNSYNLTSLENRFDSSHYLAKGSDVVALMTYEHQTHMTNLITRVGWDVRIAEHDGKLGTEATQASLNAEIEELVAYMLFTNEARIREPIQGTSTFTKTFPQRGPRDSRGRSLRDFDLNTRVFKYPLSYLIYGEPFDALPSWARDRIYRRLYEVLSGKDTSPKYAKLSADDRQAILEILRETKKDLPDYYVHETSTP
jgi:hypothetical protein